LYFQATIPVLVPTSPSNGTSDSTSYRSTSPHRSLLSFHGYLSGSIGKPSRPELLLVCGLLLERKKLKDREN
ncbi:hypothetical protein ANCDUO_22287, partial [Ancylostoma duodenale]